MPTDSDRTAWRAIDANVNRASEGLRVTEEFVRFGMNDAALSRAAKGLRHDLTQLASRLSLDDRLAARDTPGDVGTEISHPGEASRSDARSAALANLKRTQQALRAIEEFAKLVAPATACDWERLRYASYSLEQRLVDPFGRRRRLAEARLYLLLDTRGDLAAMRRIAEETLAAGIDAIQLRDKRATDRELLRAGEALREATSAAGALFLVNDRADLALALDADGVHVGQEELPATTVRELVGPARLVGVSTHALDQLRAAEAEGADYLGVGPTFPSRTKAFDQHPGVELLRQAAAEATIPWFAIGGIDAASAGHAIAAGATRFALAGALRDASDPALATRTLRDLLSR